MRQIYVVWLTNVSQSGVEQRTAGLPLQRPLARAELMRAVRLLTHLEAAAPG